MSKEANGGNSDHRACSAKIREELLSLGVTPGGVLLVHSSYKSLGPVPGGIQTVIDGLAGALGPEGTLLMPALSWVSVDREHPEFDVRTTPSCVGAIPETFRTLAGTERSMHPTHSVCGRGPLAHELFQGHILDRTPCGIHSPFSRLRHFHGQILMLGCGLRPNTSMHAVEEAAWAPYLLEPEPVEYVLTGYDGAKVTALHRRHSHFPQLYDRVAPMLRGRGLAEGPVLDARCHLLDAGALWQAVLERLAEDIHFFIREEQG